MIKKAPIPAAFVSSYVPRQCGIATFTHDLATAVAAEFAHRTGSNDDAKLVVALNDHNGEYAYGPEVTVQIGQHLREDYRHAADVLNMSRINAVSLQHEYGLYGGPQGTYVFELLDRLHEPVVPTLHTVLSEPSDEQREVLHSICERSTLVVVMAERAKHLLTEWYDVPRDKIRLIHHGVPDLPLCDTEPYKERFNLTGRPTILTFGLLSPNKGIETMLDALAQVVPSHPDVAYVILGITHPGVRRESGESYRLSLERRAVDLGIEGNVIFHKRYVSIEDLREYLLAADVYVTPYRAKEQITSGTLAYALASGRAIVSTPYWHAQELLANGRGRLADFDDVDRFAAHIRELLDDSAERESIRARAHEFGRQMTWPRVAKQYCDTFDEARQRFTRIDRQASAERKVLMRMSLPNVRLDHLYAMSDDTGLLQHATYATPYRAHGYCTDDNARALIVAAMTWSLFKDQAVLPYLGRYLAFLHFSLPDGGGRFRNFMTYDRRWHDQDGSDDCQGRALWALGYLTSHAPDESSRRLAHDLFGAGLAQIDSLTTVRGWALAMLGVHYYLREFRNDDAARQCATALADRLEAAFEGRTSDEWPWFEDLVTYDNGRVPQSLIIAGLMLDRPALVSRGLSVLEWLFDAQTGAAGHLSVIGNAGWLRRGGDRASFDQQPIEPAALIGACKAAYRASGDSRWLAKMRKSFEWYLGHNDTGVALVDFKSGGCHDALSANGVNPNEGAEALLSWLLSLLVMHELQTGDPQDAG